MVQELRNSPAPARDQSDSDSPASDLDAFLDRFTSDSFTTEAPGEEERRQRGMAAKKNVMNCSFPGQVIHVAAKIADLKKLPVQAVLIANVNNASTIYHRYFI